MYDYIQQRAAPGNLAPRASSPRSTPPPPRPPRRRALAWVSAAWLTAQIFDTVIDIGGAQEAANAVFLFWIVIPMCLYDPAHFLTRGLHHLTNRSWVLTLSLSSFLFVAACSAFPSPAPARSFGYVVAAAAFFVICSDLHCSLGLDVLEMMQKYAVAGGVAIALTFAYWSRNGAANSRLSLGVREHPNHFGLICFTVVVAGLACRNRALRIAVPATALLILAVSTSRTNLAGALAALLVYWAYTLGWKKTAVIVLLLVTALAVVTDLRNDLLDRASALFLLRDRYRGISRGLSGRADQIPVALDLFSSSPVIGNGFRIEDQYLPKSFAPLGAIHNGYLGALVEVGLLGAIPLFTVIAVGTYRLFRLARHSRLYLVGLAAVAGYLTIALSQPYLVNLANPAGVLAWMFILGSFYPRKHEFAISPTRPRQQPPVPAARYARQRVQ